MAERDEAQPYKVIGHAQKAVKLWYATFLKVLWSFHS